MFIIYIFVGSLVHFSFGSGGLDGVSPVDPITFSDLVEVRNEGLEASTGACLSLQKQFACENSPWKDFTILDRHNHIQETVAFNKPESIAFIPNSVFSCMAFRETRMEPMMLACYGGTGGTDFGLGQVQESTLEGIVGSYFVEEEDSEYWEQDIQDHFERLFKDRSNLKSSFHGVEEFNDDIAEQLVAQIQEAMVTDFDLQIAMSEATLIRKQRRSWGGRDRDDLLLPRSDQDDEEERLEDLRAVVRTTLENYNGGPYKAGYAQRILFCSYCLDSGVDPLNCLNQAAGGNPLPSNVADCEFLQGFRPDMYDYYCADNTPCD